jgi:hypothetical protein
VLAPGSCGCPATSRPAAGPAAFWAPSQSCQWPGVRWIPAFRALKLGDLGSMVPGPLTGPGHEAPTRGRVGGFSVLARSSSTMRRRPGDPAPVPSPAPGKLRAGSRPGCPQTNRSRAGPGAGGAGARKQDGHAPGRQCAPTRERAATLRIRTEAAELEATRPQQRPCAVPT